MTCDICGGRGHIRLPVLRKVSAAWHIGLAAPEAILRDTTRTYPCPECAEQLADDDKIVTLVGTYEVSEADYERYPAEVSRHALLALSHSAAEEIARSGQMEVTKGPGRVGHGTVSLSGRLGVVSKKRVSTLDQRAVKRMEQLLGDALSKATDSISNWGSHYTGDDGPIRKAEAMRFVREAFQKSLEEAREAVNGRP